MRKTACFCFALLAVGAIGADAPAQELRLPGEPPPPYLTEWGTSGTGDGQFDDPRDVAVDTAGNIYVADWGNSRIQKFDSSGAYLTQWGTFGPGDGEFGGTNGIAVDAWGNVYVADGFNRIQKFDSSGAFLAKWGAWGLIEGQLWAPTGIAVDSAGDVYVVEYDNHRVQKFDGGGTFERMWGFGVQDGVGVFQTCTSGCQPGLAGAGAGQFDHPAGVAVDAVGNVYVVDQYNGRIQKFDSDGSYLGGWGSVGGADGQFSYPQGAAVDSSGNVYVADAWNHRIQKFDGNGSFQTKWGSAGAAAGQFDYPGGMSVDAAGNVYVADRGNHRIQKFGVSPDAPPFLDEWGSFGSGADQFKGPVDVAVDASGNVYVADVSNYRVSKFDRTGAFLRTWGYGVQDGSATFQICTSAPCQAGIEGSATGQMGGPVGVAVDPSGNVYVSDSWNFRVQKFDSDGNYLTQWGTRGAGDGQFGGPTGIATDTAGNVYVADASTYRIQKFDSGGGFLAKWGALGVNEGEFYAPSSVSVDSAGNVYVGDRGNNRVQVFDSSRVFLRMWGFGVQDGESSFQVCTSGCQAGVSGSGNGQFDIVADVEVDSSGNVYVADANNDRVQKFDVNGNLLMKWGSSGTGEGEFNGPAGIAVSSAGWIYVSEGGHRIQLFGPPGPQARVFLTKWGTTGAGDEEFNSPRGVALDAAGNVYVTDFVNHRVQKFDSGGAFLATWGAFGAGDSEFNSPWGVAVDTSANVYVADGVNARIQKFDSGGGYLTQWGSVGTLEGEFNGAAGPRGVAVDASGNVYVADSANHRIQKFDGSGTFERMWGFGVDDGSGVFQICTGACDPGLAGGGGGQLSGPAGVAVDTSGNVYVADEGNYRIQKFDSSGNFLRMWGFGVQDGSGDFQVCITGCQAGVGPGSGDGQFWSAWGVAVDPSGMVYVADPSTPRIQEFDSTGLYLNRWGYSGSGDAQFDGAAAIAVDAAGNAYVSETNNDRIQKFGPCPLPATPGGQSFSAAGGSNTFGISSVAGCGWKATANHAWISVTSADAGIGNGTVGYTVAVNPATSGRVGSITIADQTTGTVGTTFTVSQDPAPCIYGIDPTSAAFPGAGGSDIVTVTTLPGCAWTGVSNAGWITITGGAAGSGSGTVLYDVDANPLATGRSGTMTIAGETFTADQTASLPAAPTNLATTVVTSTAVTLGWDDNATNEGEYRVERKLPADPGFIQIATLPAGTRLYADRSVEKQTSYVYRVLACNTAGCSAASNELTVQVPAFGVFIGDPDISSRPR